MSEDNAIYKKQGFAQSIGIGERPAVVTVDFTNWFIIPSTLAEAT